MDEKSKEQIANEFKNKFKFEEVELDGLLNTFFDESTPINPEVLAELESMVSYEELDFKEEHIPSSEQTPEEISKNIERLKEFEDIAKIKNLTYYEDLMPSYGKKSFINCGLDEKILLLNSTSNKSWKSLTNILYYEPSLGLRSIKGHLTQDLIKSLILNYAKHPNNEKIFNAIAKNLDKSFNYIKSMKSNEKSLFDYHIKPWQEKDKNLKKQMLEKLFLISGAELSHIPKATAELFYLLKQNESKQNVDEFGLNVKTAADLYKQWISNLLDVVKETYNPVVMTRKDFDKNVKEFLQKQRILRVHRFLHSNKIFLSNITNFSNFWYYNSQDGLLKNRFKILANDSEKNLDLFDLYKKSYNKYLNKYKEYSNEFDAIKKYDEIAKENRFKNRKN